jgi:hypothetical protein
MDGSFIARKAAIVMETILAIFRAGRMKHAGRGRD